MSTAVLYQSFLNIINFCYQRDSMITIRVLILLCNGLGLMGNLIESMWPFERTNIDIMVNTIRSLFHYKDTIYKRHLWPSKNIIMFDPV
jgi:hypothetical protein